MRFGSSCARETPPRRWNHTNGLHRRIYNKGLFSPPCSHKKIVTFRGRGYSVDRIIRYNEMNDRREKVTRGEALRKISKIFIR